MDKYSAAVAVAPGGAETSVTVTGRMTIEYAAQIKESLLAALCTADRVVLDLHGVADIDLIGLQFVCALHRSTTAKGTSAVVRGMESSAVRAIMRAAGFECKGRCSDGATTCLWHGGGQI